IRTSSTSCATRPAFKPKSETTCSEPRNPLVSRAALRAVGIHPAALRARGQKQPHARARLHRRAPPLGGAGRGIEAALRRSAHPCEAPRHRQVAMSRVVKKIEIRNKLGVHARAAALLVQTVNKFSCQVNFS